ncbi:MAG: VWA domain-containing protein [Oscillospiraceae bacterium]|nr:VWA domain-containing protein [Oscillospiraceae bacterium]MCI7639789.1 VWA domain-containing protein [Clostridiales bacterium]
MKHNLFSRFTSVLLAVVLLASVMSLPSLATENVAGQGDAVIIQQEASQGAETGAAPAAESEQQPAAEGEQQPAAEGEQQPAAESEQQPAAEGEQQPAAEGEQQPAAEGEQQPAAEGEQQPTAEGEQQPAAEGEQQPATEGEQPAAESEQPAPIADAEEGEEPDEPVEEEEQLAGQDEQPLDAQALLDELMAIEDDEAFLAAVQALTEEQVAALEALGEEALAGLLARLEVLYAEEEPAPVDYNAMSAAELYAYLSSLTSDSLYFQVRNSLTEEKLNELWQYIDSVSAGESHTVITNIDNGIVDFTSAAPLVAVTAPQTMMRTMMRAAAFSAPSQRSNAFNTSNEEQANGLEINKYVSGYDSERGTGSLTLEAYVTGNVTTTTQSIPVDVVLVLDQSGSMAYGFGNQKVDAYTSQTVGNQTAYYNANNWNTQYYMLGTDGIYYEVDSISRNQSYVQINDTTLKDLYVQAWAETFYYRDDNGQYYEIDIKRTWSGGSYWYTITYGSGQNAVTIVNSERGNTTLSSLEITLYQQFYIYSYNCPKIFGSQSGTSTGTNGQPPRTLYTYENRTPKALEALMDAVGGFCQSVRNDALATSADHRIAVVGYSSGGYSNTEILTVDTITDGGAESNSDASFYPTGRKLNGVAYGSQGYDSAAGAALRDAGTDAGYQVIRNAIGALTAHGGTQTLDGLNMAYDILQKQQVQYGNAYATGKRKQVVVLFTDGATDSEPTDVIRKAKAIKGLGATVYTVGIFSGANGKIVAGGDFQPYLQSQGIAYRPDTYRRDDPDSASNYLMHGVSSNYPEANNYNRYSGYKEFGDINENLAKADGTFTSYFLSASDSSSLNQVFEQISGQVGGATLESLGSTTVLFDKMSEYVSLPANVTNADIKVSTVAATGQNGTEIIWDTPSAISATVNIDETTGAVSVSGFDYSDNYVGLRDGVMGGKKLVVEIPFVTDGETFGGNNIPTNASTSGIYDGTGETCYGNFEVPEVNVPLDYQYTTGTRTVYITQAGDLADLLAWVDEYKADGVNNRFIDLVYEFEAADGTTCYYKIPNGTNAQSGSWYSDAACTTPLESSAVLKLMDCKEYDVTVTASPITNGQQQGTNKAPVGAPVGTTKLAPDGTKWVVGTSQPAKAAFHVLIPKVEVWDTSIDLGESATIVGDNHDKNNHLSTNPKEQWVDAQQHEMGASLPGNEPIVTLGHTFVRGSNPGTATTYAPTEDSYFKLTVTVDGQTLDRDKGEYDLTIHHTDHAETCLGNHKNGSHDIDDRDDLDFDFIIHVHSVTGTLIFTKTLTGLSQGDTEARFTIKVEALNEDGTQVVNTYYKTLIFDAANYQTFTMELPTGKYRVTELATGGYENGDITGAGGTDGVWELTYTGLTLNVTNTPKNPTYPSGSNTAVNHFTHSGSGWGWTSANRKPTP